MLLVLLEARDDASAGAGARPWIVRISHVRGGVVSNHDGTPLDGNDGNQAGRWITTLQPQQDSRLQKQTTATSHATTNQRN